jgi:hypothetical protein
MVRTFRWALGVSCILLTISHQSLAATPVQSASYVGGTGDDSVRSGVILADGRVVLAGSSNSPSVRPNETRLEAGDGFLLMLDRNGSVLEAALRLAAVSGMVEGASADELALVTGRTVRGFSVTTRMLTWSSSDLGGNVSKIAKTKLGYVVLVGTKLSALDAMGKTLWTTEVGKTRASALAADDAYAYVGGDQNTNTGQEPYRSPYVFRYALTDGKADSWKLYDWAGPDVRANGKTLQADSFVTQLRLAPNGQLWLSAGSDGGNTVLAKSAGNLDINQSALSGACYDGPCFGYKGAKKTGMFASVRTDAADLERASWVIPYLSPKDGRNTPACGCKGPPANPNSMSLVDLEFAGESIIAVGETSYRPPESENAWFRDTIYMGNAWIGIFTKDLRQISMATMIPGTKGAVGSALRGGRLLVFGGTVDTSNVKPNAGEETWAKTLPVTASGGAPLQASYGGGATDGYYLLACVGTEAECNRITPANQPGSDPADAALPQGDGSTAPNNTGSSNGGPNADATEAEGGCGCRASTSIRSRSAFFGACTLALAMIVRKRRRRRSP